MLSLGIHLTDFAGRVNSRVLRNRKTQMLLLVLSSFLFGLSGPLGALLVNDEDTLVFSFHFLAMLTLIQFPFVLGKWKEVKGLTFKKEYVILIISGIIGTFLYWCEFSSLQVGLPVTHVTFLLLTVPAWTLLYEFMRGRGTRVNLNKWVLALIGSMILITPNAKGQFSISYLLPVFTSLLSAAWIIYSKKGQEIGISPIVYSFFNDLFALIGVFFFIVYNDRVPAVTAPTNLFNIFIYAGIIGVLPNMFLFYGLKTTGVVMASTVIMFEPIMSGVFSILIHDERLGAHFLIGALFIGISNLPRETVKYLRNVPAIYAIVTK